MPRPHHGRAGGRARGPVGDAPAARRPRAMLDRAATDGYLFFRGLLRARQGARTCDARSWRSSRTTDGWSTAPTRWTGSPTSRPSTRSTRWPRRSAGPGMPIEAYREIYRLQDFHAIGHDPALTRPVQRAARRERDPPAALDRPGDGAGQPAAPTPAHQDFIHIQGTKNVWTAWFPLGDCPVELGALSRARRVARRRPAHLPRGAGRGRDRGVHLRLRLRRGASPTSRPATC